MIRRLTAGVPARALLLLCVLLVGFLVAPLFAGDYVLTVLILILYFAYTGQAWNIMMGFAGQLSLGHALYVGLGAYSAAALYVHFGLGPWIGLLVAVPVAALTGAFIASWPSVSGLPASTSPFSPSHSPNSRGSGSIISDGPMPRLACFCRLRNTPVTIFGSCAATR